MSLENPGPQPTPPTVAEPSESTARRAPRLQIVVPCYNEEAVLPETCKQLAQLMKSLYGKEQIAGDSSIILVDDGSQDRTWGLIREQASGSEHFQGLRLSRNRGHQYALLAGLETADGDVVISIDADLQDDLGVVAEMIEAYRSGDDIVYGVRQERASDTFFKRISAEGYYKLLALMGVELVHNHADYRLMSRKALDALKQYNEVNLFLRGIIPTLGFRTSQVFYDRKERQLGESKYPLRKMLALAVHGITSFSPVPLRLIAALGVLISIASTLMIFWALGVRFFNPDAVPGWAYSVIPIYFMGGVQLVSIGVLGEYIAKIYLETKQRPRYFIEATTAQETK